MVVDVSPEAVAGLLLELMQHVDGELEEDQEERKWPGAGEERRQREQKKPGNEAGIHPISAKPYAGHCSGTLNLNGPGTPPVVAPRSQRAPTSSLMLTSVRSSSLHR